LGFSGPGLYRLFQKKLVGLYIQNVQYGLDNIRGGEIFAIFHMHEFVISLETLKASYGVSALDMAKALQDKGMHPPTIYFPLIIHEALMVEPTETESKETLDAAAEAFLTVYDEAMKNPEGLHCAPVSTVIGRPDDVKAARQPVLRYRAGDIASSGR
jgi:glycine dehydrogenase subunit 2